MNQKVIICVDDEMIVLDALKEQLMKEFGNEILVEVAESGVEALEVIQEFAEEGMAVPVVIADFIMPEMKGDVLLGKVHELSPETKKILLTGQASLDGVRNAVNNANLYRYVSKPWDKEDLILTIKEALKSHENESTIRLQNKELSELNADLEKKVDERTNELRELNATKDKFFSIIAHDLKNPFNTLLGFSELILANFDQMELHQIKEYVSIIFSTSSSSYALLENLLAWSRSQTGSLKMNTQEIDLHKIAFECVRIMESNALQKNILLTSDVPEETKGYADVNMIKTIFRNLVTNSIKYCNDGGSVQIISTQLDGFIQICVIDNGVGILEQNLDKLFKIEVNVSTKGTNKETGTGLGLILCKEFIEQNGGRIWVESKFGEGSKFFITIPTVKL